MTIATFLGDFRIGLRGVTSAVFLLALVGGAQQASAACSPGAASPQKIADFSANPSSLLGTAGSSRSPGDVTADVRDLVISDPAMLPLVIGLLKTDPLPSSDLQKAIGTGLGLAANQCIRPDPNFASDIQTQIVGTNSADAKQQYAAITGNQLIGSVGGGAGGFSGGASGGQTSPLTNQFGGSSTLQTFLANSVTNPTTNFFSGGTTGLSVSTTINTTTTSVSSSTP
ncbi:MULTISPECIES: hypothetical protein [Bradyrhizobium]|uniref:hypothetical protein n=1 Tax=Bradyrhizobium TaxID=374 RepID=UPI0006850383|nr:MULTISPECIES: hypothetical protein [Bradyrhizobium]QOG22150.1 hypothetical protein FOM02_37495 [Bradyrhizobium sp. SEMIA]UFW51634.1 hypothetical protein BaraCB756_11945 [Bradyrhizobium arachidis]